jgi:hypothetical protein
VAAQAADSHRAAQALLAAILTRDILGLWLDLDLAAVRSSWPAVRVAVSSLIRDSWGKSLAQSQEFYSLSRDLAGIESGLPSVVPPELAEPYVLKVADMTGPGRILQDIKSGQPVRQAAEHAGVNLAGAATYLALSASRGGVTSQVAADPAALGWARITSGHPCAFCAMLASRGAVYKTQKTAGFEAHNHCACVPAPVFRKQDVQSLTSGALQDQWRQVTQGLSGGNAFRAWRKYWDNREILV